jgi:DNA-3-methyladenine glycosylase II
MTAPSNRSPAADKQTERTRAARRAVRALKQADPKLGELITAIGPHRPIITSDPFTTLLCSIISQQISMSAAAAVQRKVRDLCSGGRFSPKAILAQSETKLRGAGLSRQKARYAHDLAEHFASHRLTGAKLRAMSDDEVIAATTKVYGIGRWTAEMLLMFCLERPDVWPIDDLGLRKGVGLYQGNGKPVRKPRVGDNPKVGNKSAPVVLPDAKTMRAVGQRWRPYRTYASWYLWRSLEGPLMPGISV